MEFLDYSAMGEPESQFDDFESSFAPFEASGVFDAPEYTATEADAFGLPSFMDELGVGSSFLDCFNGPDVGFSSDIHHAEPHPSTEDISKEVQGLNCDFVAKETDEPVDSASKRSRGRFPRESVQLLKAWVREHADHPYPNEVELDQLKRDTGMKRSQIRTWLANTRRRSKVNTWTTLPSTEGSTQTASTDSTSSTGGTPSYDELSPFDRWRMLGPPEEPVAVEKIANVLGFQPKQYFTAQKPAFRDYRNPQSDVLTEITQLTGPSMTTGLTGTSGASDFSFGPAMHHASAGRAHPTIGSSRRRKVHASKRPASSKASDAGQVKKFHCTFCPNSFKTKYDWQRHEKSQHISPEIWVCAPFGPSHTLPSGETFCVFCGAENPTSDHFETHDYSTCAEKPLHKRSFYRKDHLSQHLRLFHRVNFNVKTMNSWIKRDLEVKSRCGLCDLWMTSWPERIEHLATHFEKGEGMDKWKGGYGFEPYIESMVENRSRELSKASHSASCVAGGAQKRIRPEVPAFPLDDFSQAANGKGRCPLADPLTQAEIDELVLVGLSCE